LNDKPLENKRTLGKYTFRGGQPSIKMNVPKPANAAKKAEQEDEIVYDE
jgi:hypothetical protein